MSLTSTHGGSIVVVVPTGAPSISVNITRADAGYETFTVSGSVITFPYTISATTQFDTTTDGQYSVSCITGGQETAGTGGTTATANLQRGGLQTITPSPRQPFEGATGLPLRVDTSQSYSSAQQAQGQANLGSGLSAMAPSYAGLRSGVVDPFGCGYNIKASNTQRLQGAIAKVLANGAAGEILVIGDSFSSVSTTGGGAAQVTGSWPQLLRQQANTLFGNAIDGWVRINYNGYFDTRLTFGGSGWNSSNPGFSYSATNGDNVTYTANTNGTNCAVLYYDDGLGGTFTVSVNGAVSGAGFTTVTESSAGWKRVILTGFTAANNVKITKTSAGGVMYLGAVVLYPGNQLMFHNVAQPGATGAGTGANSWTDGSAIGNPWSIYVSPHLLGLTQTDPHAVIIMLGANDMKATSGISITQAKNAVSTIAAAFPNSDIIIGVSQALSGTYMTDATWTSYASALYDLADANGWRLIDFRNVVGNYSNCVANGLTVDGQGHMLPFGNAITARAAARVLL